MADMLVVIISLIIVTASVNCLEDIFEFKTSAHPAADFIRHTLVKPKIYHGREKRQISTTKQDNGEHSSHLQITFDVDGKEVTLDLTLNKRLIPKGFFHRYQENGRHKVHKPNAEDVDHCHYNGKVRGVKDSWAAISTCDGISGVFYDGNEMHYLEKDDKATLVSSNVDETAHFLYRHSDLAETNKTCGYKGRSEHDHRHEHNRILRYKRSTENQQLVRGPYKANKESKYVELVLVVDNREYKELGENMLKVLNHCKTISNIINGLYSPLNIFIALVGVVIWNEHDEIIFSKNGDSTLTNFLHYRREKLIVEHHNDNAQLLTKFNFDNGVVGKALKGPICTYEYSGGVNTDHSPVVGLVATTVAHEMGHNFGMEHDTNECECPDDRCIMAPSSSTVAPTHWSSCSLNYLLLAFSHGMDYCLKNKPESLFDGPVCGNGFVEPGEQCDCGLPEHCDNTCCNATTCMLHANASCATGECCDLSTCRPKNAGTLCRSADYECDLPEFCTGQSEYCPPDNYKLDTDVCDGGKAFCYHGFCRTRTDQCKLLWGETGRTSDDVCYEMNKKGTRSGNCGYNKLNQSYFKCETESVLCGMLHCKHLNERLEFGMESVAILSHSFINRKGTVIACRTALVDLGINQIDPGLTPDGAKCGDGKMCVNQKCMSVSSLRKQGPACPKDCNGNGWCNNLGHCHCKDGFAPPHCDYPGPGGSEDSGPAADPNARQGVVVAMFVIFLGIVPLVALIAFLMYYGKHMNFARKKLPAQTAATSKSPGKSRNGAASFPSENTRKSEDNHSLLHEDTPPPSNGLENEFFGNFKGFTLTPIKKPTTPEPVRTAPPPPKWAPTSTASTSTTPSTATTTSTSSSTVKTLKHNFLNKPVQKINSFRNSTAVSSIWNSSSTAAPTLPPPNPGSTARPIISAPVLESSTSNAKELVSPLKNAGLVPLRPAPEAPLAEIVETDTKLSVEVTGGAVKKPLKDKEGTLTRITSFLRPQDKKPVSAVLPIVQVKATKIHDKSALRSLEISQPIPQTDIDIAITVLPVEQAKKNVVMRAQSMRTAKPSSRPNIQTFGSMRQPPGFKRPLSIPSGTRPKNPPPPLPSDSKLPPGLPGYQQPVPVKKSPEQEQYDDCLNQAVPKFNLEPDNIYAVIEESPVVSPTKSATTTTATTSSSGSSESMGLLGEIVSEIQNRNFDSIYSTSTLKRKKKEAEDGSCCKTDEMYVNASAEVYKSPESELYTNMSSNSSSSYIQPSAVNVPKEPVTAKPVPVAINNTKSQSPTKKSSPTKPLIINRQITPPNLRSRKPSPSRVTNQKNNRSVTNSPDLVTSCSNTNTPSKAPDVLNGAKKPAIATVKPTITITNTSKMAPQKSVKPLVAKTDTNSGSRKSDVAKPSIAAKVVTSGNKVVSDSGAAKATSTGVKLAARQNSNVASLQQKFEDKNNGASKPVVGKMKV